MRVLLLSSAVSVLITLLTLAAYRAGTDDPSMVIAILVGLSSGIVARPVALRLLGER
jgi:hypothetical protein